MTTKYYLKEKCKCAYDGKIVKTCWTCKGRGFTRGADVTELIERMRKLNEAYPEQSGKNYIHFNGFSDLIEVVEE